MLLFSVNNSTYNFQVLFLPVIFFFVLLFALISKLISFYFFLVINKFNFCTGTSMHILLLFKLLFCSKYHAIFYVQQQLKIASCYCSSCYCFLVKIMLFFCKITVKNSFILLLLLLLFYSKNYVVFL